MPRSTARFVAQHAEIVRLAGELLALLDPAALAADPTMARRALATLGGRLRIHAAMENEALYPRLFGCGVPDVERKARELYDSFGGLYEQFTQHARKWSEAAAIARTPAAFADETASILARLRQRIAREDAELYPMADRLDG
jgi:hypothetical protein